jgi:alpha-L-arabinofuranosidase
MKDKRCGNAVDYTDEEYYYLLNSLCKYEEDIEFHRELIKDHSCKRYPTYLSIDEWGTWHDEDRIEINTHQRQTMRDAVFAAMALHIFYRNSDIVKMAMQTQLCNLNESLFDTDGKHFVKTPTFYVMKLFKEHLECDVLEDAFAADDMIDAFASINDSGDRITLTAANKDLYNTAKLCVSDELKDMKIAMSDIVCADDVRSFNAPAHPYLIRSYPFDTVLPEIVIPPHSVVRIVLEKK